RSAEGKRDPIGCALLADRAGMIAVAGLLRQPCRVAAAFLVEAAEKIVVARLRDDSVIVRAALHDIGEIAAGMGSASHEGKGGSGGEPALRGHHLHSNAIFRRPVFVL